YDACGQNHSAPVPRLPSRIACVGDPASTSTTFLWGRPRRPHMARCRNRLSARYWIMARGRAARDRLARLLPKSRFNPPTRAASTACLTARSESPAAFGRRCIPAPPQRGCRVGDPEAPRQPRCDAGTFTTGCWASLPCSSWIVSGASGQVRLPRHTGSRGSGIRPLPAWQVSVNEVPGAKVSAVVTEPVLDDFPQDGRVLRNSEPGQRRDGSKHLPGRQRIRCHDHKSFVGVHGGARRLEERDADPAAPARDVYPNPRHAERASAAPKNLVRDNALQLRSAHGQLHETIVEREHVVKAPECQGAGWKVGSKTAARIVIDRHLRPGYAGAERVGEEVAQRRLHVAGPANRCVEDHTERHGLQIVDAPQFS